MRTGKVVPTDLLGAGNKIFHSGDPIQEDQVPRGNWEKLVAGGFIQEDKPTGAEAAPDSGKKGKAK